MPNDLGGSLPDELRSLAAAVEPDYGGPSLRGMGASALRGLAELLEGSTGGLPPGKRLSPDAISALGLLATPQMAAAPEGLGIFGGRLAQLSAGEKLAANLAERSTMPPADVWRRLGWTSQFPDKLPRFEISDEPSRLLMAPQDLTKGQGFPQLSDVMSHPELYQRYPEAAQFQVHPLYGGATRGAFSPPEETIYMNPGLTSDQFHSTLLHEIQHGIQSIEGFSRGSSPQEFETPGWQKLMDAAVARTRDTRGPAANEIQKMGLDYDSSIMSLMSSNPAELDSESQAMRSLLLSNPAVKDYVDAFKNHLTLMKFPREAYLRTAGEAESRLVQARRLMTPLERRATPPWTQFDPFGQQPIDLGPAAPLGRWRLEPVDHDPFAEGQQ